MNAATLGMAWLDARETVTVAQLCEACGLSASELDELVEYGALVPLQVAQAERVFSAAYVTPLRTAGKLRVDFDLDLFAVAMVLGYLNRIEELEDQLRTLRAQLPSRIAQAPREGPVPWREPHG